MDLALTDLRVLITAGAAGLGELMAEAFLAEGARVHVIDIDASSVERFRGAHPAATAAVGDVSDRDGVRAAVDDAVEKLGGLDVLINNAGISGPAGMLQDIDGDGWDAAIDVNLTGMFNVSRVAIPHLIAAGAGSILNIASAAGRLASPTRSPYAASKWGVVGLTRTLAGELGPHGIRANVICPGPMDTERARRVSLMMAEDAGVPVERMNERMLGLMSIRKWVDPREVARTACFVSSPTLTSFTGAIIPVDGDCIGIAS